MTAGWFGRGIWEGAGPARVVTTEAFEAHRLYIAEVRHPIEVKAGESHLNRWLSRRVGYEMPTPNLDAFGLKLLGGRLLPGNAGRPAALYMYEGPTGERFTIYSRRDQAPQTALRYRAAGPVGSVFWVEEEAAFVVSGPADRARLQKVAEAVYEQVENAPADDGSLLRHVVRRARHATIVRLRARSVEILARIVVLLLAPLFHQFFEVGVLAVGQDDLRRDVKVARIGLARQALALEAERAAA